VGQKTAPPTVSEQTVPQCVPKKLVLSGLSVTQVASQFTRAHNVLGYHKMFLQLNILCMTSYLMPSWDTCTVSEDNKILIKNLTTEKEWGAKKMFKKFVVKQWCRSGLQHLYFILFQSWFL